MICTLPTLRHPAPPLQPFITDRIVLRGRYQTVPIAVYGYALSNVAAGAPQQPSPAGIPLADALRRLPAAGGHVSAAAAAATTGPGLAAGPPFQELPAHAAHALQQLVAYWRAVGMSERAMAAQPPPAVAMQAAVAAANFMCDTLLTAGAQQGTAAADTQRQEGLAPTPEWVPAAVDMAVGWCALLGAGASGRTAHALECGAAGLAAAVLLCSTPASAALFLSRHGAVLLADVLTMPRAPAALTRHALAACLLSTLSCGALGCEAVLGWWRPPQGLVLGFQVRGGAAADALCLAPGRVCWRVLLGRVCCPPLSLLPACAPSGPQLSRARPKAGCCPRQARCDPRP